jgi:hypothetical protein
VDRTETVLLEQIDHLVLVVRPSMAIAGEEQA